MSDTTNLDDDVEALIRGDIAPAPEPAQPAPRQRSSSDAADEGNDFLMGGAGPGAKFKEVGNSYSGEIVAIGAPENQTKPDGTVITFDNGEPKLQVRITLDCGPGCDAAWLDADELPEQDNGERTLYVKYYMQQAIKRAVRAAGAKRLELGGTLTVTHTATQKAKTKGNQPAKLFEAEYTPPAGR